MKTIIFLLLATTAFAQDRWTNNTYDQFQLPPDSIHAPHSWKHRQYTDPSGQGVPIYENGKEVGRASKNPFLHDSTSAPMFNLQNNFWISPRNPYRLNDGYDVPDSPFFD